LGPLTFCGGGKKRGDKEKGIVHLALSKKGGEGDAALRFRSGKRNNVCGASLRGREEVYPGRMN